jgi:hypothetical protein
MSLVIGKRAGQTRHPVNAGHAACQYVMGGGHNASKSGDGQMKLCGQATPVEQRRRLEGGLFATVAASPMSSIL